MGRYGEEEEGIEIILPEIVPELFTSNEAWISRIHRYEYELPGGPILTGETLTGFSNR